MPLLSRSCLIVLALSVFLPSILPAASPPDCQINYRFSNRAFDQADGITNFITAGATPAFSNLSNQCTSWVAAYNSEGFSVVSVAFQSAPRATTPSGMTIGAWATFAGTTISGTNPGTSTSGNTYIATGYFPFLRINATTLTGTGSIDVLILGWKAPGTVSSLSGGTATAPSGTGCAAAASSAFTATRVLQPGTGISITNGDCTGDPAIAINTAVALTRSTAQANTSLYCRSSTGNTTGTCLLTPSLTQYDRGMEIILDSDTVNTTTYTINIDSVGQKSVLSRSGGALTAGDIPANKPVLIVYDGTQFILQSGGGGIVTNPNYIPLTFAYKIGSSPAVAWASNSFAATSAEASINGSAFIANMFLNFAGGGSGVVTDATYYMLGVVPVNWTGAVSFKLFTHTDSVSGASYVYQHHYAVACGTPGTTDFTSALTYGTLTSITVTVSGNANAYKSGTLESGTITPPTCAAGDVMILRIQRKASTSPDNMAWYTYLSGGSVSLPYTM